MKLAPGDTHFVTSNPLGWKANRQVVQWTSGKLSNEGESIQLLNQSGMVADYVKYSPADGWTAQAFISEIVLSLKSPNPDNHFPENWKTVSLKQALSDIEFKNGFSIFIYPNPATDRLKISEIGELNSVDEMYSSLGQLAKQIKLNGFGEPTIDISNLNIGIYTIKIGKYTSKVMVYK